LNKSAFLAFFKRYDFSFFGIAFAIFILGIFNLYSATHASSSSHMALLYQNHAVKFLLSIIIGFGISFIKPKNYFINSYVIYVAINILLILVLILGDKGMGAQRWLVLGPIRFQPSEFAKISAIMAMARWFSLSQPDKELGLRELIVPAIIALIPVILIVLEPDLGTGLLILLIFLVISFYRRLKWKTIGILALLAILFGGVMYQFGLKQYQRKRIITFLNPGDDARGSGYNAIQSKIAIGSGQFLGKGFKKSSQASLNYLPENHTDFVFSIFNEEHGFIGSVILIALYLILLFRLLFLAQSLANFYDSIVVVGVTALFFWHIFINMGMVMGLMPIVGLPLPLMSYGGSSLITFGVCLGIVTSISNSRNLF
jgi:rod shape determining protein RodA